MTTIKESIQPHPSVLNCAFSKEEDPWGSIRINKIIQESRFLKPEAKLILEKKESTKEELENLRRENKKLIASKKLPETERQRITKERKLLETEPIKVSIIERLSEKFPHLAKMTENEIFEYLSNSISVYQMLQLKISLPAPQEQEYMNFDKVLGEIKESIDKKTEIGELKALLTKYTGTSATIGQMGENIIEEILEMEFKDQSLIKTTAISKSGDFILNNNTIIEVKSYTKSVPTTEVDKLKRDIDVNKEIKCAILVSLRSGISLHKRFDIENYNDAMILYIPHANKEAIIWGIILSNVLIGQTKAPQSGENFKKYYNNLITIYNNFIAIQKLIATINGTSQSLQYQSVTLMNDLKALLDEMYLKGLH